MTVVYDGEEYKLDNINNFEDLKEELKAKGIKDIFDKDGCLKWNVSFYVNGKFLNIDKLKKENLKKITKMNIILQLAGG